MKVLLSALLFLCQPILWIGLIRSYLDFRHRSERTRRQFTTAIYEQAYELRHFVIGLVGFGIIFSVISYFLNVSVSLIWIISYEILTGLSLIIIPGAVFPITLTFLATISLLTVEYLKSGFFSQVIDPDYLLITSIALLSLGSFIAFFGGRFLIPTIFDNQRGNRIGGYSFKELTIVPLLIMVPGNAIHQFLNFYPTFKVGGHSVSLIFLPLLLGLKLTIFKNVPRKMFKKLGLQFFELGIIGMVLSVVSYKIPQIVEWSLVGLFILTWFCLFYMKHYDSTDGEWYSETLRGVRVMGIEPQTPAAKMNLHVGDVILNVNGHKVNSEDNFYEALQVSPTYCRLRFKNRRGQYNITETAIFNGAPHDIGVVLFRDGKI